MPPKMGSKSPALVDLTGSDDEEAAANTTPNKISSNSQTAILSSPDDKALDCRSFWKAGNQDFGPTTRPQPVHGELEHARVHPKFLHSNATSHKWAFGAIAELLDNAVDEMHNGATFVKVDKVDIMKDNSPALLFHDDGGGMDPAGIRRCMSLGYSSKKANTTIGQYGNGFKTSTMRLGADAIVFTRAIRSGLATQSVGLLSYTFLRMTGQDDVIVPMIDFDVSQHWAEPIIYTSKEDWSSNLETILEWSPFESKEDLLMQFEDIGRHGTKVILFNLWLNDEGIYELNFDDDDEDIRLRDEANQGGLKKLRKNVAELRSHISYRIRYSLRAYVSILYLRRFTNFNIILRGKPVEQYNIADELNYSKVVTYKPQLHTIKEVLVDTTIGFVKEGPALGVCGFNVYHKNRLIVPFWKVTSDGSSRGNGVVGVLEANFLEPVHDKQGFERSSAFIRLETKLKQMVMEYWRSCCHLVGIQPPGLYYPQKNLANQASTGPAPDIQKNLAKEQYDSHPKGSNKEVNTTEDFDVSETASANRICEENIKLFMRCEEHAKKEIELQELVDSLEKELKEAKRKHAQILSVVENKRKQKSTK
ncbi:protein MICRORCHIDIA 2-like isoform X2 [Momordica charantia]|uniref:Protein MICRORCHIDIA 2-like isoform X2 n=1 Tax=Momordica charantia TaxID=3673 RepID=A0A6J1C4U3_MOMCH|nr:protein MICRORCHIDIA 2-like isoform X2 [Momordica charantia]